MSNAFGDFQTPADLVDAVLQHLNPIGEKWPRVLEPTCGRGNFITGLLNLTVPPREIQGLEIQDAHLEEARKAVKQASSTRIIVKKANFFDIDLGRLRWKETGPLLVVGNPPWVTNAALGALGSNNLPQKRNLKGLRGIEALTGGSNFDIAEYIWLKLITELAAERPTIALLCKTSVARNVLQYTAKEGLPIAGASIRKINAKEWFGAAVDACLFCVEVGSEKPRYEAPVYPELHAVNPQHTVGLIDGQLVADVDSYNRSAFLDGVCPMPWRQGLKHDAASVMELTYNASGQLQNKLGEDVVVESDYVYPLLKSSDLFHGRSADPKRAVIVTQKKLGEDTYQLEHMAPQLWRYLTSHADMFERRKSSIYRNQPPFALFGIGEYTFAPYKIAISGFYKTPKFLALGPAENRPVIFDDTCYFIPCTSAEQVALLSCLLNHPVCLDFIHSLIFLDSKRPVTKKLLQRIDLKILLDHIDSQSLSFSVDAELRRLGVATKLQGERRTWSLEELLPRGMTDTVASPLQVEMVFQQ